MRSTGIQIFRYSGTQVYRYTDIRYTRIQILDTQVYIYSDMQVYSYTDTQIYSIYKKILINRKTIITLTMCSGMLCDARKIHIIIICLFQERWNLCGAREHDMARMLHKDDNCKTT